MENRVIKFKAFQKTHLGGIRIIENYCWLDDANHFQAEDLVNGISGANGGIIAVVQFTGLLDKKGKEIYEGDILHSKSWGNEITINPCHVVNWGLCGWKAQGYNGQMKVNPNLDVKSDFEVIGNIYENPELLKNKMI